MAPGQRTGIATMDADLARCSANVSSWHFSDMALESVNRLKADMINAEKFQKWFELPKVDLAALAAKAKGK